MRQPLLYVLALVLVGVGCTQIIAKDLARAHTLNPEVVEALTGEEMSYDVHHEETAPDGDPRGQDRTYYSFPEWYIVYSAQEYGKFVNNGGWPSQFPYFAAIGQMWEAWRLSEAHAGADPDSTTNTVLWTIALSFTVEYGVIGIYENTVGWLSELLNFRIKTAEDRYTDGQAVAYGEFLNQTPWYAFPYVGALGGLWQTYGLSSLTPRGIERRIAFTVGYGLKALYASIIKFATESNYSGADQTTHVVVRATPALAATVATSTPVAGGDESLYHLVLPRYRAFLPEATRLANAGADFISVEGNDTIALSVVAPTSVDCVSEHQAVIYSMPILTQEATYRYMFSVEVSALAELIRTVSACGLTVEHIYDY